MKVKKIAAAVMALAIVLGGGGMLFGRPSETAKADEPAPSYFNAATAANMVGFQPADVLYDFEDVVDYKGVSGDTGVLCTVTPGEGNRNARGYFYSRLPVDTSDQLLPVDANCLLLPVDSIFSGYPPVTLDAAETQRFLNGAASHPSPVNLPDGKYRFYGPDNKFLLLGSVANQEIVVIKRFFQG